MFTLVIAHFFLPDERMTLKKVLGLLLGFFGVLVLASRAQQNGQNSLLGMLAVVGASSFYATFIVYSKKVIQGKIEPLVIAAGSFIASAISAFVLLNLEPILGGRAPVPLNTLSADSLLAVFMLGFLNTFIAYLFFYYIIQQLGAFRASNVTYIVPVIGVVLGWLVLGEQIDIRLAIGAALIVCGIAVINVRFSTLRLRPAPQGSD
jgi:drug/metabolite transporter (DMT)-like permease